MAQSERKGTTYVLEEKIKATAGTSSPPALVTGQIGLESRDVNPFLHLETVQLNDVKQSTDRFDAKANVLQWMETSPSLCTWLLGALFVRCKTL